MTSLDQFFFLLLLVLSRQGTLHLRAVMPVTTGASHVNGTHGTDMEMHRCYLAEAERLFTTINIDNTSPGTLFSFLPYFSRQKKKKTWSNPALVRRFEELAGFCLVGVDGRLSLGGVPRRTFDEVAETVPGLQKSAMGGRAMSRRIFRVAEKLAEERDKEQRGRGGRGGREGEGRGALNGLLRMPDLYTLDGGARLAFSPRFEAARFLADVLLLSCNREDPQVTPLEK